MWHLGGIRQHGLAGWQRIERVFDAAFGSALNPLRHLGALGFLCFWLLALSGIYLYAVIDTSAAGAYRSIDGLSRAAVVPGRLAAQPAPLCGRCFRPADGLRIWLREWLHGHYQGFRRFSWLTGVPLIVVRLRQRHRRLLAQLGPARPVLGRGHRRMARRAAAAGHAAGAQFPHRRSGQRPSVLALRLRAPRRAAADWSSACGSTSSASPARRCSRRGRWRWPPSACLLVLALGAPIASHPPADAGDGAGRAGAGLDPAVPAPADLCHLGRRGLVGA